jgi:predicted TIM-barrel fold metal-dependent hydrolase
MGITIDAHRHLFVGEEHIKKLFDDMDHYEIDKTILMPMTSELDVSDGEIGDNEYVFSVIKGHEDRVRSAIYVDPRNPNTIDDLSKYADLGAVAVKMWPPVGFYPSEKEYYPIYEKIAELKLPIMVHTGYTNVSLTTGKRCAADTIYAMPLSLDGVIHAFPEINFILAHGGDPDFASALLQAYANPNVYINVCGMADETGWDARIFKFVKAMAGGCAPLSYDKIVWGSDNLGIDFENYRTLYKNLDALDKIPLFFGETSKSLYNL